MITVCLRQTLYKGPPPSLAQNSTNIGSATTILYVHTTYYTHSMCIYYTYNTYYTYSTVCVYIIQFIHIYYTYSMCIYNTYVRTYILYVQYVYILYIQHILYVQYVYGTCHKLLEFFRQNPQFALMELDEWSRNFPQSVHTRSVNWSRECTNCGILSSRFGVPRAVASDYKWLVATNV